MKKHNLRNITAIILILSITFTQLGVIIHTHCCSEPEAAFVSLSENECCLTIVPSEEPDCCTTQPNQPTGESSNCSAHCYEKCYIGNDYIKLDLDQVVKEKEEFKGYFVIIVDTKDYNNKDQDATNKPLIVEKNDLLHHTWGKHLVISLHKEKVPDPLLIA